MTVSQTLGDELAIIAKLATLAFLTDNIAAEIFEVLLKRFVIQKVDDAFARTM